MNSAYRKQLKEIIENFRSTKWFVPFASSLQQHPVYGAIFGDMDDTELLYVQEIIQETIVEMVTGAKTKWWQLFARILENEPELFWAFRKVNNDKKNVEDPAFHELWKKMETLVYQYEGILTESMLKREMWLDKTVSAYYDIVLTYFPIYSLVQ